MSDSKPTNCTAVLRTAAGVLPLAVALVVCALVLRGQNLSSLIQDIGLLEGSRDLLSSRSARPLVRKAPLPPCAPLNCSVPVGEASPFADSCVRLQDVCLDQVSRLNASRIANALPAFSRGASGEGAVWHFCQQTAPNLHCRRVASYFMSPSIGLRGATGLP